VREAIHTPYGEPKEQGFWRDNRAMEEMLAAPLGETAKAIKERPEIVAAAEALLSDCERADAVLDGWEPTATRNQGTIKYLRHDVLIHETLAQRIIGTAELLEAYGKAKALPVEQRGAVLEEAMGQLDQVAKAYGVIEQGVEDSVLEAGGGKCGWGGWYPFVSQGGVQFRAEAGRQEVEKGIARVKEEAGKEVMAEEALGE